MTDPAPTPDVDDAPPGTDEPASGRGWALGVVSIIVSVFAIGVIVAVALTVTSKPDSETRTFVIPAGTGARLGRGETVEIMPSEVRLRVGDRLVIRNEDDRTTAVGPYTVRAGETLDQEFVRPQVLVGECTLSGSGEIKIIVT